MTFRVLFFSNLNKKNMLLENQPIEWNRRLGLDTQGYLEQMLFTSLIGVKVNDIAPFCGFLDFGFYASGGFSISNIPSNLVITDNSTGFILFSGAPSSATVPEFAYELGRIFDEYFSTRFPAVRLDYAYSDGYSNGIDYFNPYAKEFRFSFSADCGFGLELVIDPRQGVDYGSLFYGNISFFLTPGDSPEFRLKLFSDEHLIGFPFESRQMYLFSDIVSLDYRVLVYFTGYKISYENLPQPVEIVSPSVEVPFAGKISNLILFLSNGSSNTEGQPVLAYKATFADGTTKIGISCPTIDLDYSDTDTDAMLLLDEALSGQLQVNPLDNDGNVGVSILKEILGDINPCYVYKPSTSPFMRLYFYRNASAKVTIYNSDDEVVHSETVYDGVSGSAFNLFTIGSAYVLLQPKEGGYECPFKFKYAVR